MSLYSEMMGSFIRTGNYPLEANYIFPTEQALKEFYSEEMNATTIHKGLLRIVENDGSGQQGLYWVTKKQTNNDLEFTKLISGTDTKLIFTQLEDLETKLTEEIKNRKDSETAIWGTNDPTNIPEEVNSIFDLAEVVAEIKKEIIAIHKELVDVDDANYKSLKTEVKALAGTLEFNVVEYLQTLPYKSLTETSNALNKFLNEFDNTSNLINTLPELKSFLDGYTDTLKLKLILLDLQASILGNPVPSAEFITLRAIEDFVRILKSDSEHTDRNILTELNLTLVGVGLNSDGSYSADKETYYLKDATSVMNALKTLDSLMYEAISGITIDCENKDVVDLAVRKLLDSYIISSKLKLSNQLGNDLLKKEDGLYFNVDTTYEDGIMSFYVNGKLIAQHVLGFSSLVDTAHYDSSLEAIIIVFKLINGEKQNIVIPVGALIREWDVDNKYPDKVVILERSQVIDGLDTLSADVRLWTDKNNILKKYGNTLGVEGTSENITHNSETLKIFLDNLKDTVFTNNTVLNTKIDSEITRATTKENELSESISLHEARLDSLETSDSEIRLTILDLTSEISEFKGNLATLKLELIHEIHLVEDLVDDKLTEQTALLESLNNKADESLEKINTEIIRATSEEEKILSELTSFKENVTLELSTKIGSVKVNKVDDLTWNILVDDIVIGQIKVPEDNFTEEILTGLVAQINEKAPNYSPILTGIPQVEVSPDENDSSQRIPSTNWVNERIKTEVEKVGNGGLSTSGFYTKLEINLLLSNKADLIDGVVPDNQLPKLYLVDVE